MNNPFRTNPKVAILWVLYAAAAFGINSIHFWAQYSIFRPGGSPDLLLVAYMLGLPFGIAFIVLIFSLIASFNKSQRRKAIRVSLAAFVWVFAAMVFILMGFQYRNSSFTKIAQNGNPIVQAVVSYEQEYGNSPESLQELIPDYLAELPHSGACNPNFTYYREAYYGNAWLLYLPVPALFSEWEVIIYLPNQNYTEIKNVNVFAERSGWAIIDNAPNVSNNKP